MRLLITGLTLIIFQTCFSQSSYVYKRTPFGQLEVYQSQGGLPTGSPLYKIKKNVYGYLEVESLNASTNPFTNRPDYSAYSTYNNYKLPAKEIFQTLEVLNKKTEYDQLVANPNTSNNSGTSQILKDAQTFMQNRSAIATGLLNFYNSNIDFPKTISDGWYDVTKITKFVPNAVERNAGFSESNEFTLGICKVFNNRITEYYENINIYDLKNGFVFRKINIDVISPIANCKSTYREKNENEYSTVYFLDNILESTKQITNPEFALYTINTPSNFNSANLILNIQIARNYAMTSDDVRELKGGAYIYTIHKPNPVTSECSNSALTFAFKKTSDKFSIGIIRFGDKSIWVKNDLSFSPYTCSSTSLTER